jgi:hypothetical protein
MKYLFLLIIFYLPSLYTHAQLAIIQDPDGYVDMRSKPDSSGDVLRKLTPADMFFVLNQDGDWYLIAVNTKNAEQYLSGYIHKSRAQFIHNYDTLGVSQKAKDKIVFKNKTIHVEVKTKRFDPKANSIEYTVGNNNYRYVSTINHKRAWGTDGSLPEVAYDYIWITIGDMKIILPAEAYDNLFQPNFNRM